MRPPCWFTCVNGRYKRLQEIQRILASKPFTFLLNFVDHTFGLFLYFTLKKSVKALVFETFQHERTQGISTVSIGSCRDFILWLC